MIVASLMKPRVIIDALLIVNDGESLIVAPDR